MFWLRNKKITFNYASLSGCTDRALQQLQISVLIWATTQEKLSSGVCQNTGPHQPARISAFVIRFLESIICKLATDVISIFQLVSVAEETGLNLALLDTPKTGFLTMRPIFQ